MFIDTQCILYRDIFVLDIFSGYQCKLKFLSDDIENLRIDLIIYDCCLVSRVCMIKSLNVVQTIIKARVVIHFVFEIKTQPPPRGANSIVLKELRGGRQAATDFFRISTDRFAANFAYQQ